MTRSAMTVSFRLMLIEEHFRHGAWKELPAVRTLLVERIQRAWDDVQLERLLPSEEIRLATISAAVQGVVAT